MQAGWVAIAMKAIGRSAVLALTLVITGNFGGTGIASEQIPPSLVTPDKVESPLGTLEFKDGVPSKATAEKLYDNLDFTYAYRAFMLKKGCSAICGFASTNAPCPK